MDFETLKRQLVEKATNADGDVAIYIRTSEGNIRINETKQMKAASVIKIPIVMACLHAAEKNELNLDEKIKVENKVAGAGVLHYMSGNDQVLSIKNLMELTLIISDNTASNMLVNKIGIQTIQQFIEQIGAKQTRLKRQFIDQKAIQAGLENYTSAKDMDLFLTMIGKENEHLSDSSRAAIYKTLCNQQQKQKLPFYQTEDITIANKTGRLDGVEHDVGIFQTDNQHLNVSVLTSGFSPNYVGQQFIADVGKDVMEFIRMK